MVCFHLLDLNCKSLFCSMFNEQTCSRFMWLLLFVTMPKISLKTLYCYIFEKPKVQGHQNRYSQLSNTQIHKYKYKYTNTALLKCQEYQTYAIFLNSCWFKDVKNDIPKCPTVKYTNTKIQIQKYKYTNTALLKCQKYQTAVFF